jgi:Chaperone of endosialidase
MKIRLQSLAVITSALLAFVLLPLAQALVPPPDGGYPGFNTAEGQNALSGLTTGLGNTAVGWFSLFSNTDGSFNTAVGAGALLFNIGDQSTGEGSQNTAMGTAALLSNTTGKENTANGVQALFSNTTGAFNTAIGSGALFSNTDGSVNTAIGLNALFNNDTGGVNTAIGFQALINNTTGNGNIALGTQAGTAVTTASNVICIGATGFNVSDSCFIDNIRGALVSPDAVQVLIDSAGKLGTTTGSSRRFKREIKPMDDTSEAILALRPVTFNYKSDKTDTPQFGLIAEDVAKVNPDLVLRDKSGEIYTVRYDAVNAMLLNEFLKEHKNVQELKATLAQQQKQIAALIAHIKEQDAKIQKVSDRLEMNNAAPQIASMK